MRLSCSAYQAGSSYAQKILTGNTQNYGATSSTAQTSGGADGSHGLIMPSWKVEEIEGKGSPNENAESPSEGGSREIGSQGAHKSQGGSGGGGAGGLEESSRHTSQSSSHSHSDVTHPPDRHNSDSTNSKTLASSCSPSDSPAHRLESRSRSKSVGEQQWTNLRAVMAWYARLRRIKRSKSNQRWMKLRTTVQLSGAISSTIQKKAPLKREDSFLKRFSTRQIPESQTFEFGEDEEGGGPGGGNNKLARKKRRSLPRSVVNPDGNFYFYWLMLLTVCVLYNLWTLIVRQSFPELQSDAQIFWILTDAFCDLVFLLDVAVQFRTGYLEQGLMVFKTKKLARHYIGSKPFYLDLISLLPTDFFQLWFGTNPMFRFPRFLKLYRIYHYYYMVESRTVYPNVWRVVNLIHILLLLAHWFGCFYYVLSEAEGFRGPWVYPNPNNPNNSEFAPLTRKYLGSLYWSTLTLTTIGDLPTPYSNWQYLFTIVSYLIGVFIFATIVGQVGNVITNRNANRLEFERLLDGAKTYMRHHKVPRDMQRRVLRWYDYSWSRGRIQGGGDINTALGLLPDKLKTELALHVNLSVLKKVTIFQECQPEFLHDLVLKMKAYIFTPGDLICRKGEVAREMFIIADGILEVISELGKVLTTMQAGDFFGEIGILNLDGLNKRTADVRSVGYSELFSLSREDVLAAMKDYPEAQEILQTLGRKRLMEARKASGPAVPKKVVDPTKISSPLAISLSSHNINKGPDTLSGDEVPITDLNTGKRIVEKLRSDVKGLRNAIRRSRKSNSSKEDSSEPESGKADEGLRNRNGRKESTVSLRDSNKSFPPPRGVLKRMHHVVLSDDKDKEHSSTSSSPSMSLMPMSSGVRKVQLPLGKASAQANTTATSPEQEPEVIGAGLPLIQRLRLLRQKEERERRQLEERENMLKSLIPPPEALQSSKTRQTPELPSTGSPMISTKATVEPLPKPPEKSKPGRWSKLKIRKDKKEKERGDSVSSVDSASPAQVSSPPPGGVAPLSPPILPPPPLSIPSTLPASGPSQPRTVSVSSSKSHPLAEENIRGPSTPPLLPSTQTDDPPPEYTIEPMPEPSSSQRVSIDSPLLSTSSGASSAPSSTVGRPSALPFKQKNAKTYGSVDDLSPEFSRLPFIRKLQILNERQKIADILRSKTGNTVLTRSTSEGSSETGAAPGTQTGEVFDEQLHSLTLGRRSQSNREHVLPGVSVQLESGETTDETETPTATTFVIVRGATEETDDGQDTVSGGEASNIQSEIERDPENTILIAKTSETIPRSQSPAAATEVGASGDSQYVPEEKPLDMHVTNGLRRRNVEYPTQGGKHSTPMPKRKKKKVEPHYRAEQSEERDADGENEGEWDMDEENAEDDNESLSPPLSPESNETPERRNLKSILKRLAESAAEDEARERESDIDPDAEIREYQRLIRAPTLEGFAARHRKFSKNVTFQRQAVNIMSPEAPPAEQQLNHWQNQPPQVHSPNMVQMARLAEDPSSGFFDMRCDFYDRSNGNSNGSVNGTGSRGWPVVPLLNSPPPTRRHPLATDSLRTRQGSSAMMKREREVDPSDSSSLSSLGIATAQEECIGGVFLGIRNIIRIKMEEIHHKFQDRFQVLETEVKRRDEIITVLQLRIQELEDKTLNQAQQLVTCRLKHKNGTALGANGSASAQTDSGEDGEGEEFQQEDKDSPGSSRSRNIRSRLTEQLEETDLLLDDFDDNLDDDEDDDVILHEHPRLRAAGSYPIQVESSYLFSRGDSIDTVISNQDFDDEVFERADIECAAAASQLLQEEEDHLTTWAQIAEEETIEMSELGPPSGDPEITGRAPWEHEFHRDRDSFQFNKHLRPAPQGDLAQPSTSGTGVPRETIALNLGNLELTDYENSSSSEEEPRKRGITEITCRDKTPRSSPADIEEGRIPFSMEEEEEEEDDDGEVYEETDEDSDDFNNLNWEAKMLAKEMKKKEDEKTEKTKATVGEMRKLEDEIRQMQDCFAGGALSPSELDMLESVLESKTKRVKALYKACSVEAESPRRSSYQQPSTSQHFMASQPHVGRSCDDFRRSSAPPPPSSSHATHAQLQRMLSMGIGSASRSRLSLSGLNEYSRDKPQQQPGSSASVTNRLSPGERRDLQKLVYSRKKTSMRRQGSLCETRETRRESAASTSTTSSGASTSGFLGRHRELRRESAGAISTESTKSFFSKFSFVRQFTSRTVSDAQPSSEQVSTSSTERDKDSRGEGRRDSAGSNGGSTKGSPSNSSRKSSSAGLVPLLPLSSSALVEPSTSAATATTSFSTPSTSVVTTSAAEQKNGESQPLLKK